LEGRICQPKFHFQNFVFKFLLEFSHDFSSIFSRISFQDFDGNYQGISLGFILKNLCKNILKNVWNLFTKIVYRFSGIFLGRYTEKTCGKICVQYKGGVYTLRGKRWKLVEGLSPTNEPQMFPAPVLKKM